MTMWMYYVAGYIALSAVMSGVIYAWLKDDEKEIRASEALLVVIIWPILILWGIGAYIGAMIRG